MKATELAGTPIEWSMLSPLLVVLGAAMFLLVVGALTRQWPRRWYAGFTVGACIAVFVIAWAEWRRISEEGARTLVGDALRWDHFTLWLVMIAAVAIALSTLVTDDYLQREGLTRLAPEIYSLYLLAALGGIVMGAANDLIVLFLGLECLSISLYVLAASNRRRRPGQEAALKYFILGGAASAVFLYGIALIYGAAGSTQYVSAVVDQATGEVTGSGIVAAFDATLSVGRSEAMALAGVALLLVGLAFKTAAAPFHFWAPDVYEGAPTPVTGFMASMAKAAAFAAMLRVLLVALPHWSNQWQPAVWALSVITLVVGSVMAVVQTNVKRMLAFSSISHAGFLLVGVEAAAHDTTRSAAGSGVPSVMLYLFLYSLLVVGTFAVVTVVARTGDNDTGLSAFRGLAKRRPVLALAMTVLLIAQAGVPLTSGFVAKFGVLRAAVQEHSYALAIIAMVAAVIAAYLYLRIMLSMWSGDDTAGGDTAGAALPVPLVTAVVIGISVAATVIFGLFPGWLVELSQRITVK